MFFSTDCFLRVEQETGLTTWLFTMGFFVPWKILSWTYTSIVNDLIFSYHIFTFLTWLLLHVANVFSWLVVYSLYLELRSLSMLENSVKMKIDTMGSTR